MNLFIEIPQQRFVADSEERVRLREQAGACNGARKEEGRPACSPMGDSAGTFEAANYSVQQESYRKELAYGRHRSRRKKLLQLAKHVLMIIGVPLLLACVFIGSYALTCILDGATPEEVWKLLMIQAERLRGFVFELLR